MSLIIELRRRNVFRVAATYFVASWVIIQVVTAVSGPLNFPGWFDAAVIVLLVVGFPVAMVLAWAFELTPDGIKVTPSGTSVPGDSRWRTIDTTLVLALLVVAALMAWGQFRPAPDDSGLTTPIDKSVAVLPFTDMSPEGDQAYFGDGIAAELIDELNRLDGLRVASRTSSFGFRDGQTDARAIGRALGVSTVLEGSVRIIGDRVRVTAQLIDTDDGIQRYSQSFDRYMSDIFAIQDEIAAAVAGALGVSLGVGDVNAFRGAGTTSVEAYELYLRAMRVAGSERRRLLERAVQLDPNYGAALAALGLSIAGSRWTAPPEESPEIHQRAHEFLMRAVEVDPESAYAYSLLGSGSIGRFEWIQAEQYQQRAIEIQPDGELLDQYANLHMRAGRSSAAIELYSAAENADRSPSLTFSSLEFNAYLALGRFEHIEQSLSAQRHEPGSMEYLNYLLGMNRGDTEAFRTAFSALASRPGPFATYLPELSQDFDSPETVLATLRELYADKSRTWASKYHDIAQLAAFFGDAEFALEVFSVEARLLTVRYGSLWYPVMADMRRLPAFKELMLEVNLVPYWREYGWPDHCRPLTDDDFECF